MLLNVFTPFRNLSHKLEILVRGKLWLQVIIGLLLGLIVGILLGPNYQLVAPEKTAVIMEWLAIPGYVFLRLIKMIVIPLVVASIIRGIGARSDLKKLRSTGIKLLFFILMTTTLAIIIGIFLASILKPGTYVDLPIEKVSSIALSTGTTEVSSIFMSFPSLLTGLIPENPFGAILNAEMIGVVVFSLLIGIAIATLPNRRISTVLKLLDGTVNISMTIVKWAMFLAPLAVFGLIAKMASQVGLQTLFGMSVYMAAVIIGLAILLIVYYLLIIIFSKKNIFSFARDIAGAQLLAFSTTSSAAVMPLSIRTAEEKLGVDNPTAEMVIPIGATMNMAGTALYQAIALMFLAQMAGIDFTLGQLVLVIVTLVASAIGVAGTPGAGVIILATIAANIGIPTTGMVLIIGVDRILDMFRTSLNVTGDLTASVLFAKPKISD